MYIYIYVYIYIYIYIYLYLIIYIYIYHTIFNHVYMCVCVFVICKYIWMHVMYYAIRICIVYVYVSWRCYRQIYSPRSPMVKHQYGRNIIMQLGYLLPEEPEDEDHPPRQRQSEPAWGRTEQGRFGHASWQQIMCKSHGKS